MSHIYTFRPFDYARAQPATTGRRLGAWLALWVFALAGAATACPAPADMEAPALYGLWAASFDGTAATATLLLERHKDFPGSLSGAVSRSGVKAFVAGDLEGGEFTLEESADGVTISATWTGRIVEGSCGREIHGEYRRVPDGLPARFVLKKQ